jgi:hypothetical protein
MYLPYYYLFSFFYYNNSKIVIEKKLATVNGRKKNSFDMRAVHNFFMFSVLTIFLFVLKANN